jgi:hypothetical protein
MLLVYTPSAETVEPSGSVYDWPMQIVIACAKDVGEAIATFTVS